MRGDVGIWNPEADDLGLEAAEEGWQTVLEHRPVAILRPPADTLVVALGRLEVGIDEAGEDHPAQHGELPSEGFSRRSPGEGRQQSFQRLRHDLAMGRIEEVEVETLEPTVEIGVVGTPGVGQPRMMAGDRMGNQRRYKAVIATSRKIENQLGTRRRVINPFHGSGEPGLERRRVFANVVQ